MKAFVCWAVALLAACSSASPLPDDDAAALGHCVEGGAALERDVGGDLPRLLGGRAEEEVETVAECLPAGAVHVGMYSYGEIAPPARGGRSQLHNQTMTVTVLGEA